MIASSQSAQRFLIAVLVGVSWLAVRARAAETASADFERVIRPLLQEKCFDCHDGTVKKGRLQLDTVTGLLSGGDSGEPLFLRGDSAGSLLIKRVSATNSPEVMPPKGERLTAEQVATLRHWIEAGAKIPGEAAAAASLKLTSAHWSFQPVKRPPVPSSFSAWPKNEIDHFVAAKLAAQGLAPAAPAERATIIRRLYLVAHGLPPTPAEVDAFRQDTAPGAYERLIDQVLASPRFGERWARHWMDVVRYADSNGFETNRERKTAYPYRDYLIAAFNGDKPYDQFIREQLAGDALGVDAATGFLVAGAYDIVKAPDINLTLMQRQDELADIVNTTGTALLGLTVGCARCHNHKFDPILQKDYYAMQAVFAGVNHGERILREKLEPAKEWQKAEGSTQITNQLAALAEFKRKAAAVAVPGAAKALRPAVNAQRNEENFSPVEVRSIRLTLTASSGAAPGIDELEVFDEAGNNVALAASGAQASASGTLSGFAIHKLEHLQDGRWGNQYSWIASSADLSWVQIDLPRPARIKQVVWGRDRTGGFSDRVATRYKLEAALEPNTWKTLTTSEDRAAFPGHPDPHAFLARLAAEDAASARRLLSEIAEQQRQLAALVKDEKGWVGTFNQPEKTHRLYRGEPLQKREVVAPDSLTLWGSLGLAVDEPEQQRRIRFAAWIASPQNPLTARVLVNRLWHYTFGQGIVDTPSDFGLNGSRPTHPELLDWLADEFVGNGWSIKRVLREIFRSNTFQQASIPHAEYLGIDAASRSLWRYPPRRLEAEAIRDSMLGVSGALDLKMGGPGFYLVEVVEENVMHYFPKEKYSPADFRRMVYLFRVRAAQDGVFGSFDCPDGGQVMAKRSRSNTPLQALNLFNSSFVMQQAERLADRLRAESGSDPAAQAARAFALFYARPPDAWEQEQSVAAIREQGLKAFGRALYNSSEFLFIF